METENIKEEVVSRKRVRASTSTVRFTPEVVQQQKAIKARGIAGTKKQVQVRRSLLEENIRKRKPSEHSLQPLLAHMKTRPPVFKKMKSEQQSAPVVVDIPDYRKNDPQPILHSPADVNAFFQQITSGKQEPKEQ